MSGSVMLDVAIGLILIFLILSFVAAAIRESLEVWLKHRAKLLHQGVLELLHDPSLTKDLYEHPLISSLYRGDYEEAKKKRELPSYIPSRNFALALLDMTARGRDTAAALPAGMGAAPMSMATLRQNITQLGNNKVQRVVLAALDTAAGDLAKAQEAIETWFDTGMDRVSGWYKRKSQWMLVVIGFAVAAIANVDTFAIARHLYNDPGERQAAVAMAGEVVKQPAPSGGGATDAEVRAMVAKLDSITLPIGWPTVKLMSAGDAMSFAWTTLW